MKPPSVLLIDDEAELVQTFVERLQLRDINAEAATNGHDALERLGESTFDVVVADLKMPGLGGLEVVRVLRERYPSVKVILITGHGRLDHEEELKQAQIEDILIKPFNIDALVEAIHHAMGREHA